MRRTPDPNTVTVAVALNNATKASVVRAATQRGISVSRLIRLAVGQFLAETPAG